MGKELREKQIKALQKWYEEYKQAQLSDEDAVKLLATAEYYGASLLCAAYDISVCGETDEMGIHASIN